MHYERVRLYKGPGPAGRMGKAAPIEDRFENNVNKFGPVLDVRLGACYQWAGYCHRSGFGAIGLGRRLLYVHRYAWAQVYGPIPAGVQIVQVCGNRLCVRVDHLRAK